MNWAASHLTSSGKLEGTTEKERFLMVGSGKYRVSVLQDQNVLKIGWTTMWIYLTLLKCIFKTVKMENLCHKYFTTILKESTLS